ncbi:MAG: type I restriction enzyme HsdR N-terminal domain-containing protein [Flavobacteriales bacterium]
MSLLRPLNLPQAPLKLSSRAGRIYVNCLVRKKPIVLTPEEWVRQHLISYLHLHQGYAIEKIGVEKQLLYEGFTKRWDIVVFNGQFEPAILIECKAPDIKLSHEVFMQIATYQQKLNAQCLILSNGQTHLIYEIDAAQKQLLQKAEFPRNNALSFE